MSRIGRTPIKIPENVLVTTNNQEVIVKGKLGELSFFLPEGINIVQENNQLNIKRSDDSGSQRSLHGLSRSLVNNMVIGVNEGYEKVMQIIGTGYTAEVIGKWLRISVGFSHEIFLEVPDNLEVTAQIIPRREQGKLGVQAVIKIKGIHKEDVGKFAAEIRRCRPPENYKGKGIRYEGEYVKIKAGKAGAK